MRRVALGVVVLGAVVVSGCGDSGGGAVGEDLAESVTPVGRDLAGAPGDDLAGGALDGATSDDLPAGADLAELPDLAPPDDLFTLPDLAPPDDLALPPCNTRCPNGCCQNESCLPPSANTGCATGGVACVPCPAGSA